MRNSISRTMVAGVAALAMAAAVILPTTPASAGGFRMGGGGWHGGGWGGGWHGGGWGGGGWRGAGWRGGWAGGRVWHGGYWNNGIWYNGWWGPAIAAGVLAGAALATYPAWGYGGYGYGYGGGGGGCWQYRPTYDGYGNPIGQSWVNLC
jgi:hypothetical protein